MKVTGPNSLARPFPLPLSGIMKLSGTCHSFYGSVDSVIRGEQCVSSSLLTG